MVPGFVSLRALVGSLGAPSASSLGSSVLGMWPLRVLSPNSSKPARESLTPKIFNCWGSFYTKVKQWLAIAFAIEYELFREWLPTIKHKMYEVYNSDNLEGHFIIVLATHREQSCGRDQDVTVELKERTKDLLASVDIPCRWITWVLYSNANLASWGLRELAS